MIAVDTNLLVYAHRAGADLHRESRAAIERAAADPRGWGVALPALAEFWAVVTHPASAGGPSPAGDARRFLEALRATAAMQVWCPAESLLDSLVTEAVALRVRGARVFDLQMALIAREAGAEELWTHDAKSVRLRGLRVRDPLRGAG